MSIDLSQYRATIGSFHQRYINSRKSFRNNIHLFNKKSEKYSPSIMITLLYVILITSSIMRHQFGQSVHFKRSQEMHALVYRSKITPVVCPGTTHTNPLMTIGGHPTNTMGPRLQVLGLVEGVPEVKMGVERQQQFNRSYKYIVLTSILKIHPNDY